MVEAARRNIWYLLRPNKSNEGNILRYRGKKNTLPAIIFAFHNILITRRQKQQHTQAVQVRAVSPSELVSFQSNDITLITSDLISLIDLWTVRLNHNRRISAIHNTVLIYQAYLEPFLNEFSLPSVFICVKCNLLPQSEFNIKLWDSLNRANMHKT